MLNSGIMESPHSKDQDTCFHVRQFFATPGSPRFHVADHMHNRKHGTTTERRPFASDFHPGPARYVQLVSRAGIMQSTLLAWQSVCPPWQHEEDTNDVNCSIAACTDESVEQNSMPPSPANYARARWTTMRRLADGTAEVKRQSRHKRVSPFRPAQPGMFPPGYFVRTRSVCYLFHRQRHCGIGQWMSGRCCLRWPSLSYLRPRVLRASHNGLKRAGGSVLRQDATSLSDATSSVVDRHSPSRTAPSSANVAAAQ